MIEKLKEAFNRYHDAKSQNRCILVTPDKLSLISAKSGRDLWTFRWDELDEVVAYKVDAIVVDHICLGFRTRGNGTFHVTDEETPGWHELNDELSKRFGIAETAWFSDVAFPAFAQNWTVATRHMTRDGAVVTCISAVQGSTIEEPRSVDTSASSDVAAPRLVFFRPIPNAHALGYVDHTAPR